MADDNKLFEKYLKVCALSERGEGGEARNALGIKIKMERDNPWLSEALAAYRAQEADLPEVDADPPPHEGYSVPWEGLFTAAQTVYSRVSDFAETVSHARHGAILARACKAKARMSRSGSLLVGVSVPDHILDELASCNKTQLRVFRNTILEGIEEHLNDALGLED